MEKPHRRIFFGMEDPPHFILATSLLYDYVLTDTSPISNILLSYLSYNLLYFFLAPIALL